ncbi:aminotransferase class IV [Psychroflexus sp. CAK57W]|uniref:aminotransferase class IV n=1 Tax=Psychroflexus curvus TaxID=2873595 RepID=UPI001CC9D94C|nr:aminotransferase class IV [Psychroflexus curvus]MBZ9626860.1 aminotransferase class IV [Psychroflexus curvus]MBZ9786634.1 aminotransferase class IV [Psychroflexus curvus]
MNVFINGEIKSIEHSSLNLNNRGYNYGDGLFETLRVINSKIMFWESHYFRLMSSMRILRMTIPMEFSPEYLEEKIIELIKANDLEKASVRVKINIHRNEGGFYTPEDNSIGFIISTKSLDEAFFTLNDQAYEVELFKDHYIQSGMLSTIKSNNKLVNILAGIYAKENDFDNCFLINEKKSVLEVTNGNIFMLKGDEIKTPPLSDGCLNGIIRKQLIEILKKSEDYTLKEESISPFELQKADEIFYTNAIQGIQSISKYRKKRYTNTLAKSLIGKLNAKARLVEV